MNQILGRIANNNVRIIIFTDNTILNIPIHKWPRCDAFIAFYSLVSDTILVIIIIFVICLL